MTRILVFILLNLISISAFAHPGHDHESPTSVLVHFFWVLPLIVAGGLFTYLQLKKQSEADKKDW
ncbi:hypothetical protein SOPP22_15000 [Shewanella sp. OPT22]|nr:hypothetical protein SOPP22_15000 [Shewanella sp. OPT22]